ncbi:TerB family tellurite resistance protein [Roseofilum sp. BLCC_M91]|uniref:TerB family tellurite resistance protein n=1 Tax=Roseofilum halophilum BLCC-M91 TaxID=3022259 RepID=A0ABT7BJL4_9CYAN|nr:hypothetical protein [Roseofilum halophilum]MDJ1179372.1 TerB family tellurite resistance protein [Roseofilum halophilum BLCC-M91]
MAVQPPPPPPITPRQMNVLRVVTAMAWSDGELATEEVDVMLDRFSKLFAPGNSTQQEELKQELRDYMMQNLPLEELIPKLETVEERKIALKLGYQVIASSARTPDEELINAEEEEAYKKLVQLVKLPPEEVASIAQEAAVEIAKDQSMVESLTQELAKFVKT